MTYQIRSDHTVESGRPIGLARRRWSTADFALFLTPLLAIATAQTPIEPAVWIMIPLLVLSARPLRGKNGGLALTLNDVLIVLLIFAAIVSWLVSDFREVSLVPTLYFVAFYLLVLAICITINSFRQLGIFLSGASLAYVLLLVRSIIMPESTQGDIGLTGVLGQQNATGSMAAAAIVTMLTFRSLAQEGYATIGANPVVRWGTLIAPLFAGAVLLLSASRGAAAGTAVFLGLWSLYAARRASTVQRLLSGIVVVLFALLSWSRVSELYVFKRFHYLAYELHLVALPPVGRHVDALDIRGLLVDRAVEIFKTRPLTGSGLGTFEEFTDFVYTHTTFYEFVYALGLLALVPLVILLLSVAWRILKVFLTRNAHHGLAWSMLAVMAYVVFQSMSLPLATSRVHLPVLILLLAGTRLLTLGMKDGETNGGRHDAQAAVR